MTELKYWLEEQKGKDVIVWFDHFSRCFKALNTCDFADKIESKLLITNEVGFVIAPFSLDNDMLLFKGEPTLFPFEISEVGTPIDIVNNDFLEAGKSDYLSKVTDALNEIRKDRAQKIVVSRIAKGDILETISGNKASEFLYALAQEHSHHFIWLWLKADGTYQFGASPEYLLKFHRGEIRTLSLAGTEKKEQVKGAFSAKNQMEQEWVTLFLQESFSLAGLADIKAVVESPLHFGDLAHIRTGISGRGSLEQAIGLLNTIQPTPATGGYPQKQAIEWIKQNESPRGYYAGFLGPVYGSDHFEMYVNLRSFEVKERSITMRAGAGIVEGSIPEEEWEETQRKIEATLNPLMNPIRKSQTH